MEKKDVWGKYDFTQKHEKSAYDYLIEQKEGFNEKTRNILNLQIEAVDAIKNEDNPLTVALYSLYVIAPLLGNFRRKILVVLESDFDKRFPVEIYSVLEDKRIVAVQESNFLDEIEKILNSRTVKGSIENLYSLSLNNKTQPANRFSAQL